ncbi:hypothetical protein [Bacillus sp. Marseille-P3661]|uniref:hypothetical protein n=1 Tax=Bacillus sp. Marseille-P3661 TaxID=1936234 RepID=UPI000C827120|nr:hypothetical protein [Bacillus sp. Marseille-P3661]
MKYLLNKIQELIATYTILELETKKQHAENVQDKLVCQIAIMLLQHTTKDIVEGQQTIFSEL